MKKKKSDCNLSSSLTNFRWKKWNAILVVDLICQWVNTKDILYKKKFKYKNYLWKVFVIHYLNDRQMNYFLLFQSFSDNFKSIDQRWGRKMKIHINFSDCLYYKWRKSIFISLIYFTYVFIILFSDQIVIMMLVWICIKKKEKRKNPKARATIFRIISIFE